MPTLSLVYEAQCLDLFPNAVPADTSDMNTKVAFVSVAILALGFANSSAAQEQVGIRAGVSGDPDQFVFGGHIERASSRAGRHRGSGWL